MAREIYLTRLAAGGKALPAQRAVTGVHTDVQSEDRRVHCGTRDT